MVIEPWYWLILGFFLIILDLFLTSFVSLTVGIAAVITGLFALIVPMNWFFLVILWLILSVAITALGFKYIRPKMKNRTTAGTGLGIIVGQTGMIVTSPQPNHLGKIRFSVPIFGADEWQCRSNQNAPLQVGDRVVVIDVIGNELLVESTLKT